MKMFLNEYDVIVVGAGHAGSGCCCCRKSGFKNFIGDNDRIFQMSCNQAMGGIAKGQVVRD
jgi:tRNA uridine 5-carboxymethylaminomethyl modification enzyme